MFSAKVLACAGAIAVAIYAATLIVYRLFFHPLAAFPGPKLAAATLWYEFYYDCVKRGQYTFKIGDMHKKYGPIVRISPDELHCNDPSFIDTLYAGGSTPRDKYKFITSQFGIPESGIHTASHDLHRIRRGALNRFFSKASVTKLEPLIHNKIDKLCSQLNTYIGKHKPVRLDMAFTCFTTDVVSVYAFGKCYDFLDGCLVPTSWITALYPDMGIFVQFQKDIRAQVQEVKEQHSTHLENAKESNIHTTIFHALMDSNLTDREKSVSRLWQEGQAVIGAGSATVAWALTVIFCYTLNDRRIYERLMAELEEAIPDSDARPACISEGLRLSYGVSTRLQRISPDGPMIYRPADTTGKVAPEYVIPQGTPVGMTSVLVHHNPDLFPRPEEFDPERWLDSKGKRDRTLEKYIIAFSRGSRQCLGINLAYAELFMATGLVFRRLGSRLKLYETGLDDVEIVYDCFVPMPKADSKGVRVVLN